MNRNQLRYFVSAAEHRSFTKAAEQYYISQTAVTQQIQQLALRPQHTPRKPDERGKVVPFGRKSDLRAHEPRTGTRA